MRKVIFVVLLLAGCKDVPLLPSVTPYKIDIQQGNYVTQDMVAKLKPGMTRSQVRFALGTPLVADPFHTDRWDYVYVFKKAGELVEQRHISIIFQDDKLVRIEGDVVPAKGTGSAEDGGTQKPKPDETPSKLEGGAPEKPEATKPQIAAPDAAAPAASTLSTTSGEPVQAGAQTAEPTKAQNDPAKPEQDQPQEEKGFFGRMMEKLGF